MSKYVIANHKLNPATLSQASLIMTKLADGVVALPNPCTVGVAPSVLYLPYFQTVSDDIKIGVQDITHKTAGTGAFTGDISAIQVANMGATFTLVGHSERRLYHHETDEVLIDKLTNAFDSTLSVIYCIGETKDAYEQGKTFDVLTSQLMLLKTFANQQNTAIITDLPKLMIAYEPIWAIGTGLTPSCTDIDNVHCFIKKRLAAFDICAPILYGGSVNEQNSLEFAQSAMIDGVLVGGASLQAESFLMIIQAFS